MNKLSTLYSTWNPKLLIVFIVLAFLAAAIGLFVLIGGVVSGQASPFTVFAGILFIALGILGVVLLVPGLRKARESSKS